MNISLTPVLESFVKAKVESGLYNSASEVIRESLRALQEKEVDSKIQIGLEQAKAGMTVPFNEQYAEDLISEMNERIESRKTEKNA